MSKMTYIVSSEAQMILGLTDTVYPQLDRGHRLISSANLKRVELTIPIPSIPLIPPILDYFDRYLSLTDQPL